MNDYPEWVLLATDAELTRRFGINTVARGRQYAANSRVTNVRVSGDLVMAQVRGSGYQNYHTSVRGPAHSITATCTCPVGRDCKHSAALILHLRAQRRHATPAWQQALDPLLQRTAQVDGGVRLALQFNDVGYGVTIRPLKRGQRDAWVKTGATWDDVRYHGYDFDPGHRQVMLALLESRRRNEFAYGHRVDALPLSELRPDVWSLLRHALDLGIEFVAGDGPGRKRYPEPLLLDEPLEPTMRVDKTPTGLRVTPALVDARALFTLPSQAYLGRPPHGVAFEAEDRLVLGALTRPLDAAEQALFLTTGAIDVPEADIPLFATGFLPQLRQRLSLQIAKGVDLPEATPPVLVCRVEFGARSASLHWTFRYTVGDRKHDLGLSPDAGDPPVRHPAAEAALAASVPEGAWRATGRSGTPELRPCFLTGRPLIDFVAADLPTLRALDGVLVEVSGDVPAFREATDAPTVTLKVTDSELGDWFDLGVEITIGDERVPFAPLFTALAVGDDHLLLDSGTWFALDRPELDHLRALIDEARVLVDHDGDSFRLRPEHAGLWEELVSLGVVAEQSAAWEASVGALLDLDTLPETPVPAGLNAELRPYQVAGFRWLSFLWKTRLGGVLADEMGLGKTLQALALAQSAHEAGGLDVPMLVVAPTSVIGTWQAEAARFTPELKVVAVTETETRRGVPLSDAVAGAHVVVTSYTLLRLEADDYRALTWSAVLLDEAQFVKNHASKAYQAVRKLRARTKVALTGTPLENNLMDLWSLLSITASGLFADPKAFTEVYRKPIESGDAEALARLHRRIRPLILRRTKAAVASELPDKQEQLVPVELTPAHRRLYDRQLARERQKVLGLVGDLNHNRITILRSLTLLRQLSLSPSLVDPEHAPHSAKIDVLVDMLHELIAEGHRALVFSQFTGFLALVKARLDAEGIAYEYLDGRTRDRAARIDAFRTGDAPAFLISLKAGGFGLTLTEADYVFILDPWWNPAAESQAIDRTHRIGQDKPVNVYRLVSTDTIEDKVVALQEHKRHLFDQVVGAASDMAAPLSAGDIRGLLDA
jgi:superfamily II DNA or RNA helicase